MLTWFRTQVKNHGVLVATGLLVRVLQNRALVVLSNKLLPARFECPCCGWKGRRFFDYIEAGYSVSNAACPGCDSHSRHRAFYLWLKSDFRIESKKGRALVFAPERALAPLWNSSRELRIIKTDIEATRGVDLLSDVMQLPFANESVSLVWCHHVLEQVEDDRAAMHELHRVLASGGELLISAGQSGLGETQELGMADSKLSGNRRLYGNDFADRLRESGFAVTALDYNLTAAELSRFAIFPEGFYRCVKG